MSDVNGAAPAAAEQTAAPETQVSPPNPIESTGPTPDPKPEPKAEAKADKPSSSISEALKKAEAKVAADAKAKETPKAPEKPAKTEAKADAKTEPKTEAKEVKSDGPTRGEDGKFASKDPKPDAKPTDAQPWRETPKRFSEDGKRDWENAPDSVKAETHRAIRELESGLKEYKDRYEPLKQYDEIARQNNTTVKDALDRYTTLEKQLTSESPQDKWAALQKVFDYAAINVREFAAQIAGVRPDQVSVHAEQQMQQFRTRIAELEHELSGYRTEKEQNLMKTVDEFAARQPRFDELAPKVAKLLESGLAENLQEAYAMADRLIPAAKQASAEVPVTPETPAAHTPAKSVAGSPSPGSSPTTRKPSNSIKEALQRAMAQAS